MDNPDDGTNAGTFVAFDGNSTVNGFVFTHNLGRRNTYGIRRDGMTDGIQSIEASVTGNMTFERNGIAGCSSSLYDSPTYDNLCPTQTGCIERPKDVDITLPSGNNTGHVVNNFQSGEWLEFTVSVATAGSYTIQLKVSSTYTAHKRKAVSCLQGSRTAHVGAGRCVRTIRRSAAPLRNRSLRSRA